MRHFHRIVILAVLALGAMLCQAQKQAAPVTAKPCCTVLLMAPATGEPVPGAEILIEQEPNNAQRAARTSGVTDARGIMPFTVSGVANVKVTVKIGLDQIAKLKKKSPKAEKVQLTLRVTSGKTVKDFPVTVQLNATVSASENTYNTSVSNMEEY